jgi:hypothetical protein
MAKIEASDAPEGPTAPGPRERALTAQAEWFVGLLGAANHLGYLIESIGPRSIVVCPIGGHGDERITLSSILLSGAYLRLRLMPVPE